MEKFFSQIERGLLPLLGVLLAFITAGVFIQVVLRYLFAKSFLWGEELSLFAFIWCIFLGAAVCSWRRTHFAFESFSENLKGRIAGLHQLVINLSMMAVTVMMVIEGWHFSYVSVQRLSPALGITLFVPTIVIPIAGAMMLLVNFIDVVRGCRRLWMGDK